MGIADIAAANAALMTGVATWVGEEYLINNDAPPRVIWVPTRDQFDGALRYSKPPTAMTPRSIFTRRAGCQIHVWGAGTVVDTNPYKDIAATELLLNRFLYMLRQVAYGAFTLTGGSWLPKANRGELGRCYLLDVTFDIPVVPAPADDATTSVTLTNVDPMSGTAVFPGSEVTGDPAP